MRRSAPNARRSLAALPRLLFISPCTPDPHGTGWEQRNYWFLAAYSRFMEIDLWFRPTADNPDLIRIRPATEHCRAMTAFYPQTIADAELGLKHRLRHSLTSANVVHVGRLQELVASIAHPCVVWDIDELPWLVRDPGRNTGLDLPSRDQQKHLSAHFLNCVHKCRRIFASSHLEQPDGIDAITVIPNVVVRPDAGSARPPDRCPRLLFVGNLNHPPNLLGLEFFRQSVLPALSADVPDVGVTVVGRGPATTEAGTAVKALQLEPRMEFAFDAPNCTPFYAGSAASIAPLVNGGGTRIKIIESFAHRCPVVSTTAGCEGLDVANRKELLIADDPKEFAFACEQLIVNPALGVELARNAFDFFERNHSQVVVDRLVAAAVNALVQ